MKRIVIIAALITACAQAPVPEPFPIVGWHGPSLNGASIESFQLMRDAGFNISFYDYREPEANLQMLNLADSANIQLLLTDRRISRIVTGRDTSLTALDSVVQAYSSHPAFFGYFLDNESGMDSFEALHLVKDSLTVLDAEHSAFINIHPNYATPAQMDTASYEGYVNTFLERVHPDFFSFNHFPILEDGLRNSYYENLGIIRTQSIKHGIPFWSLILSVAFGDHPKVEASHIRLQIYSALAYGATGIQYFSFFAPGGQSPQFGDAIMDQDGRKTSLYTSVKNINRELQQLGPVLQSLTSTGVFHCSPVPSGCKPIPADWPIVKLESPHLLAGFFKDAEDREYVLLVNKNYEHGFKGRIYFEPHVKKIVEIPKTDTAPLMFEWDGRRLEKDVSMVFKAGDGRLFRIVR